MNELDEAWSQMLAGAIENARTSGRGDVADYLTLKRSNDAIRQASVGWLFDSLVEIALDASHKNPVKIEREEPHEFPMLGAKMAGSLMRFRHGLRCLTVEAGWTRTPTHGFMRGGALAAARFSHFGLSKAGVELVLVRDGDVPVWNTTEGVGFDLNNLRKHVGILLEI